MARASFAGADALANLDSETVRDWHVDAKASSEQGYSTRLIADPNESRNIASEYPNKVKMLGQMLIDHRALQPRNAIPAYQVGSRGFVPPPKWQVDLSTPDALAGSYPNGEEAASKPQPRQQM